MKKRRRAYSPVHIARVPEVDLPPYITDNWERVMTTLATDIAVQEAQAKQRAAATWYEVFTVASEMLGGVAALMLEAFKPGSPRQEEARDAIPPRLHQLAALCIRWWLSHENQFRR